MGIFGDLMTFAVMVMRKMNCEDCIKNGGDWECDHIHCHKGSPDINIGNMVNREAVAWMIRDTCIELAKTADRHYDEHIDDYIIDDQEAVRWLSRFNTLAQKKLKELPPAERVGYRLRCIDCAHYNDGF